MIYRVAKLTHRDILSSKYTSTSFFSLLFFFALLGLLVKKIRSSGFYLLGPPIRSNVPDSNLIVVPDSNLIVQKSNYTN